MSHCPAGPQKKGPDFEGQDVVQLMNSTGVQTRFGSAGHSVRP